MILNDKMHHIYRKSDMKEGINIFHTKNGLYRVENTPIGHFSCNIGTCHDGNEEYKDLFVFNLPLIPEKLISHLVDVFRTVYYSNKSEFMAQIFYSFENKNYNIYYPYQSVTDVTIDYDRNNKLEDEQLLVMDIHSHHTMSAEFSYIDDKDEKGTRLYGVVGDILNIPSIKVRAGTGGYFTDVDINQVSNYYI